MEVVEVKSIYKRMTKYRNKEMLYKGKVLKSVFRSDVYKPLFAEELRVDRGVGHALIDYTEKIQNIGEKLRNNDEWYMIWTNGATEGEKWK